jgi:hypothetical protein
VYFEQQDCSKDVEGEMEEEEQYKWMKYLVVQFEKNEMMMTINSHDESEGIVQV